mgnify:CR=1 FL=1
MMQQHSSNPYFPAAAPLRRRHQWLRRGLSLGLFCTGSLFSTTLLAQVPTSMTQIFDNYDLKHYATSQMTGQNECAMAGTVYDYDGISGNEAAHLLLFDPNGNTMQSTFIDAADFAERTIGVHYNDPNNITLVTSRTPIGGNISQSGVQIFTVDIGGNIVAENVINSSATNEDLWPMGTAVDPNNNTLYICGYATTTLNPGDLPEFSSDKVAFLMQYDIAGNRMVQMRYYDWAPMTPGNDYDVAHRIKFLESGNIWMGGMCNSANTSSPAMMNIMIDPSTLNSIVDEPIEISPTSQFDAFTSFDIWEDQATGQGYVFGNYCALGMFSPNMDVSPIFPNITSVDINTLIPAAGNNHAIIMNTDYEFGNNLVYGNQPDRVILSGFRISNPCGASQTYPTNPDNINPFLTELELTTSGSGDISVVNHYWATIESAKGTGIYMLDPNSYTDLGGPMSNIVMGPVNTIRDNSGQTTNIILSAPVWNNGPGRLNMKYLRTDDMGNPDCEVSYCDMNMADEHIGSAGHSVVNMDVAWEESVQGHLALNIMPDGTFDCNSGFFKDSKTGLNGTKMPVAFTVSPNPAQDYIHLELTGTTASADQLKVLIHDVTGKVNTVLYEGAQGSLQAQLALPQLAPGVYMVRVLHNGQQLKSAPLVIK